MKKTVFIFFLSFMLSFTIFAQDTLFVKNSETSTAWTGRDAYTDIQEAIDAAQAGDQIWVEQGTYYPTSTFGNSNDVRCKSFVLKNNVSLYGGFQGTENSTDERVSNYYEMAYPTLLSGDIAHTPDVESDNSYHVVYGRNTSNVTIDGFTISGGFADRSGYLNDQDGGGVYMGGNWMLRNCIITGNTALKNGGGVWVSATGSLSNCYLSYNMVTAVNAGGGGAYFDNRSSYNNPVAAASDCFFEENSCAATNVISGSNRYGGGAVSAGQNVSFEGCYFMHNTCTNPGGAVICSNGNSFSNCMFYLNEATEGACIYGGSSSNLRTSNCLFANNEASGNGGGIRVTGSTCCSINCTFVNNNAAAGAAVYGGSGVTLFNSIVWNNGADPENQIASASDTSHVICMYTAIQGVLASGEGNLNVTTEDIAFTDPCAVIGIPADEDELVEVFDAEYTISANSVCKDAGDLNIIYLSGYQFPDEDLNGDDRVVGTAIDLGCYENLCANIAPTFTWTIVDTIYNDSEPGTGSVSIEFTITNYDEDYTYFISAGASLMMDGNTITVLFDFPGSHTYTISYSNEDCGASADTTIVIDSLFSHVGIMENEDQAFSFFPNPVRNSLTVESESPISEITICDLTGRTMMVSKNRQPSQLYNLNTSSLPAGIYMLKVITRHGTQTAKFVKQ